MKQKRIKQKQLLAGIGAGLISLGLASSADAALIGRLATTSGGTDYQAYYDTVADLTWLADANYAQTSGYAAANSNVNANGSMGWQAASDWAAGLTVGGVSGWRLADTLQPDASCAIQSNSGASSGVDCTGSEMGGLYYTVLGNVAGSFVPNNTGPFSNVQLSAYWSATESASATSIAWLFNMSSGAQNGSFKTITGSYGWAVQSGDISAVPVPAAVWLFGSGLLGLVGVARRKRVNV